MKSEVWMLCFGLLACSLVSGTPAEATQNKHHNVKVITAMPTEAPLMKSTVKPTVAPLIATPPTKPMVVNLPPKSVERQAEKASSATKADDENPKLKSTISSDAVGVPKEESLKSQIRVRDSKPVQVTGFITKTGNIYEIENKDGIGMIEGRQNSADAESEMNVCNYGTVVIYSDVPCEQVSSNISVGDVVQTPIKDKEENAQAHNQNQNQVQNQNTEESGANAAAAEGDADDEASNKPRRQNNQNRRRNQQNRRRRNKNRRASANQTQKRRRSQSPQKRRRQQQQQRRRQQQNTKRRQQNNYNYVEDRPYRNRNRNGNANRRRHSNRNTVNRNRNRGQNFQQRGQHLDEYDWSRYEDDY